MKNHRMAAALALLAATVLMLSACSVSSEKDPQTDQSASGGTTMTNPFSEFETLEEAEASAGVDIQLPEAESADRTVYRAIPGSLLEVIYYNGDSELLRIRKAPGSGPIDGDYNTYEKEYQQNVPFPVTLKANSDKVFAASWSMISASDGNIYSYSISSAKGITEAEAASLAALITTEYAKADIPDISGGSGDVITDENGLMYSSRTVLIVTEGELSEEELSALLKKYSLSVKYGYKLANIYALSTDHDMDLSELNGLLESLRAEKKVISAEPDSIIELTDPVTQPMSVY